MSIARRSLSYSVAVLGSGGLLDAIAAVRSGFVPVWGTEICPKQASMWKSLFNCVNYPDTFKDIPNDPFSPIYLKSGTPCPNYTEEGAAGAGGKGEHGTTGWMFVAQGSLILQLKPKSFCLEMTDNAININNGAEVDKLIAELSGEYYIHYSLTYVWEHGDPTSRRRLFIVGFHKSLGPKAKAFQFPKPCFNRANAPCAADIAVPDDEVPEEYWIRQHIDEFILANPNLTKGDLNLIAQVGEKGEFGPPSCPCAVYSWQGLLNAQLTTNGGGRRPPINWWFDAPLTLTRMTVPRETVAAASLPDDYINLIKACHTSKCSCHKHESEDEFLRRCVNNGVPLRTGVSIDLAVLDTLRDCGVDPDVCGTEDGPEPKSESVYDPTTLTANITNMLSDWSENNEPNGSKQHAYNTHTLAPTHDNEPNDWVGLKTKIKVIHVDTMANKTFVKPDATTLLYDIRNSKARIKVANKQIMHATCEGSIQCHIIKVAQC